MKIFEKKSKTKVVIVGAGFAGLSAAKILPPDFDITVIDPWPYFEFLPNIHELVSSVKKPRQLRLSRKKIVENMGHRYLEDRVSEWEPDKNRLKTQKGDWLSYDFAICATGGVSNFFGVPGAEEIAFDFKSVRDCHSIGKALDALASKRKGFSLVIVGGGIEGVESMGEVLRKFGGHDGLLIHLVDGQPRTLSFGPPGLHDEVVRLCRNLPVLFHMQRSVKAVYENRVILSDDESIAADMVIWTGGVKPRDDLFKWGLAESLGKWAGVKDSLQHVRYSNIFVAGDSALTEKPVGKQAYHAVDMGERAAKNVILCAKGKAPLNFKPSSKPTLVTFGHLSTFLVSKSFSVSGPALSFVKEAVYQAVMLKFDPGWKVGRAIRLAKRASTGLAGRVLPLLSSPGEIIKLADMRFIG